MKPYRAHYDNHRLVVVTRDEIWKAFLNSKCVPFISTLCVVTNWIHGIPFDWAIVPRDSSFHFPALLMFPTTNSAAHSTHTEAQGCLLSLLFPIGEAEWDIYLDKSESIIPQGSHGHPWDVACGLWGCCCPERCPWCWSCSPPFHCSNVISSAMQTCNNDYVFVHLVL